MARYGYNDFADYNQIHAQAQAVADVRDDAAEEDRRRRVKEENLAAFDAAREEGRSGRSMITASAFDGDGMRRDYMGGRLVGEMPLDSQGAIAAEFMDLANRSTAAKRHNAQIESDSLNSAMMAARRNGGRLPQNAVDMLSRKLGLDGKTSAVFGAGYLGNGDFDIDIVTRGQDGGLQRRTKKISPLEQYNLMLGAPGVWGAEGQAVADGLYQRLRGTRGKSELAAPSTYGQNLSAYQDGQRTKQEMQAGIELLKLAKEFSGNGKGGEEALLKAVVGNKVFASILARGDRIYEDAAGNEVDNPYEEDGKTLRKDVKPKLDDKSNIMYREDPELAFQRIHKAWERVNAGGGANGGGIGDAIMQVALSHLSPRQPSSEEAEIAQRQRQNALDDQRRADVMRGRDQQLIHYIDENGTHKVGSGYVVDGKVYDGDGNEMSGVRLADRNGRPLRDEIDERLAQRAADRAQGGGGLAGTTAADVVSGGGGQPQYGLRNDGKTYKGTGWLGVLPIMKDGKQVGVASEYTMQSDVVRDADGNRIDFPTLVPTLTKDEVSQMVNDIIPNNKPVPDEIAQKAVDFAKMRIENGMSVFANDGQPPAQVAQDDTRVAEILKDGPTVEAAARLNGQGGDELLPDGRMKHNGRIYINAGRNENGDILWRPAPAGESQGAMQPGPNGGQHAEYVRRGGRPPADNRRDMTIAGQSRNLVGRAAAAVGRAIGGVADYVNSGVVDGYQTGGLGSEPAFDYSAQRKAESDRAAAEKADAEQSRRAQEYYSRKLEQEQDEAFVNSTIAELESSLGAAEADRQRHDEIVAAMDRRLSALESERRDKAGSRLKAKKDAAAENARIAELRRVRDLYSKGDMEAIRKKIADDNELASLIDEVLNGERR